VRPKHEKDNKTLLNLSGAPVADLFPPNTLWGDNIVMWNSEIGQVVSEDFGSDVWSKIADEVRVEQGIDVGDINKKQFVHWLSPRKGVGTKKEIARPREAL